MLEPNYHTTTFFAKHLLAIKIKKKKYLRKKPVYFALSILELSKIIMYKFWYACVKPKHSEKARLYYMDTDIVSLYT